MGFLSSITKAIGLEKVWDSTVGKVVNTVGSEVLGGILDKFGMKDLFADLAQQLSGIPGMDGTAGVLLGLVDDVLNGDVSLAEALIGVASVVAPGTGQMLAMADADNFSGLLAEQFGGQVDLDNPLGQQGLLVLEQMLGNAA